MHVGQSRRWNFFLTAFRKLFNGEGSLTVPQKNVFLKWIVPCPLSLPGNFPHKSKVFFKAYCLHSSYSLYSTLNFPELYWFFKWEEKWMLFWFISHRGKNFVASQIISCLLCLIKVVHKNEIKDMKEINSLKRSLNMSYYYWSLITSCVQDFSLWKLLTLWGKRRCNHKMVSAKF